METKILKLRNGEEIVGNVSIVDGEFLKIQNPLKVNIYPRMKGGRVEEAMAFSRWISYSDNQSYDIIKNNVTVSFGKGEDNKAKQLLDLAQENGFEPQQKSDVAWMTLTALFRERIESGLDMPSDIFSTWIKDKTKITRK